MSAASVQQLATYAVGDAKALADCHSGGNGCYAVFYMNPNHVWEKNSSPCLYQPDASEMTAASESWFVHNQGYSDAAHRIYGKDLSGCIVLEMNPGSSGLQAWWLNYLQANADAYDAYLIDDSMMDVLDSAYFNHSGGGCNPWPTFCRSTQEIPNDAAEVMARVNFVNAMSHSNGSPLHFFFQQASFNIPLDLSAFAATNRFVGMSCEGCIATPPGVVRPNLYAAVLNEMAAVNATSGEYLLISKGTSPSGSAAQILQRLVSTGIVWLAYSEGHTIARPNLEADTNNLAIWPENLIYPSGPLQSMLSGANDLAVQPGVWRREFTTCYQKGAAIGPCAAIVNANPFSVSVNSSWLRQTYHHVITLAGGDVLSGGIADMAGASFVANSTQVRPSEALLLAP